MVGRWPFPGVSPRSSPVTGQGSFPPPALPGLVGTTSPSAICHGRPRSSRIGRCPGVAGSGHRDRLPLLRLGSLRTCCHHYPGGTAGCASRSLPRRRRPSPFVWRVSSHDDVSRPARCSLALRPVRFAVLPRRSFPRMLQVIRHLLTRPRCFRPERELPGGGRTHLTETPLDKAHTRTSLSEPSGRLPWAARTLMTASQDAGRASVFTARRRPNRT